MQLNNDSKPKLKIRTLKNFKRTSTNLARSRSQRKITRIKTKISKQITNVIISKILINLKQNVKITLNEDEIDST